MREVIKHYREFGQLPGGPIVSLLSPEKLARAVLRGELEHRLRVAAALQGIDRVLTWARQHLELK